MRVRDLTGLLICQLLSCSVRRQQLYFLILRGDLWGWCFRWWSRSCVQISNVWLCTVNQRAARPRSFNVWQINYYQATKWPRLWISHRTQLSTVGDWAQNHNFIRDLPIIVLCFYNRLRAQDAYPSRQQLPPQIPPPHGSGWYSCESSRRERSGSSASWSGSGSSSYKHTGG